jgi:hypothetical protein
MVFLSAVSSENSVVGGTDCLPLSFFFINAKKCVKFLDIALHWKYFQAALVTLLLQDI